MIIKNRVRISTFSAILTMLILIALTTAFILLMRQGRGEMAILIGLVLITLIAAALFYTPLSVQADGSNLSINRLFRSKRIPLDEIVGVKLLAPTMGAKRICGSGGFFGYWGWFSEGDTGKYFGYYGKSSDCFLVRLKNGRQYVIGCENPQEIVDALSAACGNNSGCSTR